MNEELKNEFSIFFGEKRVFDRKSQISEIAPNIYSNLWISRFSEK